MSTVGEPVADQDMQRSGMGEAAYAFDQRPQDILTLPVARDRGCYVVYGQYPPEGSRVTTFECHYDNSRIFRTVYGNRPSVRGKSFSSLLSGGGSPLCPRQSRRGGPAACCRA